MLTKKNRGAGLVEALERRTLLSVSIGATLPLNLSRAPGDQAEGTIAVDPLNPQEMFVASNNGDGVSLFGAYSTDGGKVWQTRAFATGADGLPLACCDPSAAFDSFGNLFFTYLGENTNRAELLMSTDGGQSFTHVASLGVNADQPTVAVGHGEVWVAFQQTVAGQMPRSSGTGKGPAIDPHAGAVAYGTTVSGLGKIGAFRKPEAITGAPGTNVGDIAVGPAGQLVVGYQTATTTGPSTIFVRVDPDGLGHKGLGPPIAVGTSNVGDFYAIPAQSHRTIDAEVGLAYDMSGDAYAGRLYMIYTDESPAGSGNTDIELRYSDNDGLSWSAPIRVNDDSTQYSQFFPRVAVDPATGAVGASWYDCRNDTGMPQSGGGTDSVANDEPQFWGTVGVPTLTGVEFQPNIPITTGFSNTHVTSDANDFGDYTGLAFMAGVLSPVWADNSNSTSDNPDGVHSALDLYIAHEPVTGMASPSRTLLGEFGNIGGALTVAAPGGTPVTLSVSHGTGYVFSDGATLDIALASTGSRSIVTIKSRGRISLGSVAAPSALSAIIAPLADLTGTLSIVGAVRSISIGNVVGGTIAVNGAITTLSSSGLAGAKVLDGIDLGPDGQLGGGDDSYSPGEIGSIRVTGAVTQSFIAVGFAPADGLFDNTTGSVVGGARSAIRTIVIRGGADAGTHFVAGAFGSARLPARINPATDARFTTLP